MDTLLWRALNRIRPRDGWVVFLLTWAALLSVAAGVQRARWVPEDEFRFFFIGVTLAGGLVGLVLARSRLAGSFGGVAFVVNAVGRVLPPWRQLTTEFGYLGQWLGGG